MRAWKSLKSMKSRRKHWCTVLDATGWIFGLCWWFWVGMKVFRCFRMSWFWLTSAQWSRATDHNPWNLAIFQNFRYEKNIFRKFPRSKIFKSIFSMLVAMHKLSPCPWRLPTIDCDGYHVHRGVLGVKKSRKCHYFHEKSRDFIDFLGFLWICWSCKECIVWWHWKLFGLSHRVSERFSRYSFLFASNAMRWKRKT